MPTYEYVCDNCAHEFEQFQSITARPLKKCPQCGRRRLRRLIGSGGGIIFKGPGFYQTDYRSAAYNKAAEAENKDSSTSTDKPDAKDGRSAADKSGSSDQASNGLSTEKSSIAGRRRKVG